MHTPAGILARPRLALPALLAAALVALGGLLGRPMTAGAQPEAPPADERVVYAPSIVSFQMWPSRPDAAGSGAPRAWDAARAGVPDADAPPSPAPGLTVQNGGDRAARVLAFLMVPPADGAPACEACAVAAAVCGPVLAPGAAWRLPADVDGALTGGPTWASHAVAYSLNMAPARDFGDAWAGLAAQRGLDADAPVADVVCDLLDDGGGPDPTTSGQRAAGEGGAQAGAGPTVGAEAAASGVPAGRPDADCAPYLDFHAAYVGGGELVRGVPIGPARGAPIAAVARSAGLAGHGGQPGSPGPGIDRYRALPLSEVGRPVSGTRHAYHLPGLYLQTPDGRASATVIQNAGLACADVTMTMYRTNMGQQGAPFRFRLAPGAALFDLPAARWPIPGGALLAFESDQPLAIVGTNYTFATSATHTAVRARTAPVAWAAPLAWQEDRPDPGAPSAGRNDGADGWETNLSVFNPTTLARNVEMRLQATGRPPRPIEYPIGPGQQVTLQPGFGLGLPGGRGWARFTSGDTPLSVAVESLRESHERPFFVEGWSTAAWPLDEGAPAPRTIVLPDLGGPSVGAPVEGRTLAPVGRLTTTLRARIAVHNVATRTVRAAIDTYADGCGFAGTHELVVDPFQAEVVAAGELPGVIAHGADAARVRVLEGQAAVVTAITREARFGFDDLEPDLSAAYLGTPHRSPVAAPTVPTVTLSVTPTRLASPGNLPANLEAPWPEVRVSVADGGPRCASVHAVSDSPWLRVHPAVLAVPGVLRLGLDPAWQPRTATAEVTITAGAPGILGGPWTVEVRILADPPPTPPTPNTPLFVPLALARHPAGDAGP